LLFMRYATKVTNITIRFAVITIIVIQEAMFLPQKTRRLFRGGIFMEKFRLGRTALMVSRSGFGAIPIQRISFDDAKAILRRAYDSGINYFDTARAYTDSEEKIGYALSDVRQNIIIATKSQAHTAAELLRNLDTSLAEMKTDYIDIYQFHNPPFLPDENHEIYQAARKAQKAGKIRFISITSHRLELAKKNDGFRAF